MNLFFLNRAVATHGTCMIRSARIIASGLFISFSMLLNVPAAQPGGSDSKAAPAPPRTNATGLPMPLSRTARTNIAAPPGMQRAAGAITNKQGALTNAATKAAPGGTNAVPSWPAKFKQFQSSRAFMPVVIGTAALLVVLLVLGRLAVKKKVVLTPAPLVPRALAKSFKQPSGGSVHACNVLEVAPGGRQVWQFEPRGNNYVLRGEQSAADGEPLPGRLVGKSWRSLFQRKLNIAWLPPEYVFLRVIHLPRSDFAETLSMVELQLEKLSPMPVAQTAWSIQVLPHAEGNLQTIIVMIVSRNIVEEFLGKLEEHGFLADRLELPLLDQLQATAITEDGAYLYPEAAGGKNTALVAWWYGGVLQNLDLLTLPANDRVGSVREQLTQMAWAGEMEGWLKARPDWHLVADGVVAGEWEPILKEALETTVDITAPLPTRDLAALTARRSAHADPRANLLPPEFTARYHQQFVDRLWMRGLLAIGGLYAIGVLVYMVALGVVNYKTTAIEKQVAELSVSYTNALQLKARWQVLKDRQELKYAALDCWSATAQHLPENVTLESLNFSQGKHVTLSGSAPADAITQLNDFESAMRKHSVNNQPLFDSSGETLNWRVQGSTAAWTLGLELKRSEALQ